MTLQLLICTFNDGIKRIPDLLLPPIDGVEYLVSWQQADDFTPHELPEEIADRSDVEVTTLPGLGLSRNRNNCFLPQPTSASSATTTAATRPKDFVP